MASGETITVPNIQIPSKKDAFLDAESPASLPPTMMGLATDYANSNKWFAYFPLESNLGKRAQNLELHLTRFSLPQMVMGSMTVPFKGYQKEMPTKVMNAESKELTLEYIVDSNWNNYKCLFKWMSGIYGTINPSIDISDVNGVNPSDYVPLRIYLLDSFKKKIIQFLFENCWIKMFNDLALEVNNSDEVHHSFTVVYDRYSIEDV